MLKVVWRLLLWLECWISLFESIVGILTLSFYMPSWSFKYISTITIWQMNDIMRKREG